VIRLGAVAGCALVIEAPANTHATARMNRNGCGMRRFLLSGALGDGLSKCYNGGMSDANRQIERLSKLSEQGKEDDLRGTTVEERWNMMWQLTVNAWAMKGEDVVGQEFQRHVERLERRGR